MKYLREAMEDYEYFRLLDEAGEDAWVTDVTRTVAPKTFQWEHDWRAMLDWRRKVAEKILGTLDEVPPGPPADLSATGAIESVELAFTAPPDADLAGYDIYYAIYEGDAFFGGRLGADATSAVVTNLPPGRDVTLWIRAFDENGNRSDESESVTATPLSADDDDDAEDDDTVGGDGFSPNLVSVSDGDSADSESDAAADGEPDDAGGCGC
ncbi:MAG: fibronectin type III domain-containing protein [Deltaproteobacteria bacterium]|nr:fibronectin type III domain-containing protein [Deltaproteobacteria bacterium]